MISLQDALDDATMAIAIHLAPLIAEWRHAHAHDAVQDAGGQLMTLDVYDNDLVAIRLTSPSYRRARLRRVGPV